MNQKDLGFAPVDVRIADLRETCAEKLARFRRVMFARDVYDLHGLIPFVRDDIAIIRELLLYKVYFDVVDDRRGDAPFEVEHEYRGKRAADVRGADELGVMTGRKIDLGEMLAMIEATFGSMSPPLSAREVTIARCNKGSRYQVERWHDERRATFHGGA